MVRVRVPKSTEAVGLYDFIPTLSKSYKPPRHLDPLVIDLERAWVESVRDTAHAPPRHAKTDTVLAFIALTLLKQPHRTLAYVTYGDRIARSKARKARQWAEAAGVRFAKGAENLNEMRTAEGGGLLATAISGPLTSQGVDILLVDDPYKDRVQAESAAWREKVTDWWGDIAETRLEPGSSAFIFHTRWHPDDLIGHVHGSEDAAAWRHLNMPAVSDAGVALWPERWPLELLEQKRRSAGEYTWASLFQGRPRPRGGSVFGDVHHYSHVPTEAFRVAIGVDLAYSKKTSSDWSVAVVLAECKGTYYVLDVVRRQQRAPEFKEVLRSLRARFPSAQMRWYCSGTEMGVADLVNTPERDERGQQRTAIRLNAIQVTADKFVRAQPVAAAWNGTRANQEADAPYVTPPRVLLPQQAPWLTEFVTVVTGFTGVNDAHDDDVDALAAGFDALPSTGRAMTSKPGTFPQSRI
jgi:predicted phage terminase large subunit-like protein